MPRKRDLSPEENERLREVVRELLKNMKSQRALAPKLGITQAALSGFLSGRQGSSWGVAVAIARLVGGDVIGILAGGSSSRSGEEYPNRARAATAARALGFSEEAISSVCSARFQQQFDDLSPFEWLDDMRQAERRIARGLDPFPVERPTGFGEDTPKREKGRRERPR